MSHAPHPTLGLAVRFRWGRQRVGAFFLHPDTSQTFTVGTDAKADFFLDEPQLGGRFTLVRIEGDAFVIRFSPQLAGARWQDGKSTDLGSLVEEGSATFEGDAYALFLQPGQSVRLALGGLDVELAREEAPRPVWLPWQETTDFLALNLFLAFSFLAALGVILSVSRNQQGSDWVDELEADYRPIVRLIHPLPPTPPTPEASPPGPPRGVAHASGGSPGHRKTASKVSPTASAHHDATLIGQSIRELVSRSESVTSGLPKVLAEMRVAADDGGFGGLRPAGRGVGPGDGNTIGLQGSITRFANRRGEALAGVPLGLHKTSEHPEIEREVGDYHGLIDPELIRRVIHSHRDQIRCCYELELNHQPNLAGTVKVRFVIGDDGSVAASDVIETTAKNLALESCLARKVKEWHFPVLRGGGRAVVSYPFLFKPSGD